MRITVAAVSRVKRGPVADLCREYARRLTAELEIREVEPRKRLSGDALKDHEADLLAAQIPDDAVLIALDEHGAALSSQELADRLGQWRDTGRRDLCFLIGGALGLAPSLRDRAALVLAFGPQTWPHLLVRVMLLEQIYRAETILSGHPYHRA